VALLVVAVAAGVTTRDARAQGRTPATAPRPAPGPRQLPVARGDEDEPSAADPGEDDTPTPHPAAALAKDGGEGEQEQAAQLVPKFATGFVLVTASYQAIPRAVPRNRYDGSLSSVAGVAAVGQPLEKWDYLAYVLASLQASAVSGTGGAVSPEQITIKYTPTKPFSLQAGWMRLPFSLSQSSVIATSMFPTRPEASSVFQTGADAGLLAAWDPTSGLVHVKAGVFDGLSLGLTIPQLTTRGPVTAASVEVTPLGPMKALEADFGETPFRVGLSASALYRSAKAFDPRGYEALTMHDARFALALRASWRGAFLQGEYLQAVQTDDLSRRPRLTRGAYAEASYYLAVKKKLGLSPVARVSWSVQDESFFPLHVMALQAGLALYPRGDIPDPSALRFILQYRGERRVEELEVAHGAILSGMYRF
jgi:hypothetical protein